MALGNAAQVAFDQRDARALHRHVRARAHGDADMGGGERRSVIDAVAGHRDDVALLAKLCDLFVFVARLDSGFHLIESEFLGHGMRGAFVVAGQHDDF